MGFLGRLKQPLIWLLALTLPFTFLPCLEAIIAGALFEHWWEAGVGEGVRDYLNEQERLQQLNAFSMPGAPSFLEWRDSSDAFQTPTLHTVDWVDKLRLVRPIAGMALDAVPIDRLASLEDLASKAPAGTQHWIYVSGVAMPPFFPWDEAFMRLLEYHNAHPLSHAVRFAHITCGESSFLCHVWQVEPPALVHLLVEDGAVDPQKYAVEGLRPVTARVIDLGLSERVIPGRFPTMFEQMRSLVFEDGAYSIVEPLSMSFVRFIDRANLRFTRMRKRKGSFLGHMTDLKDWIEDHLSQPLGITAVLDVSMLYVALGTFLSKRLISMPWRFGVKVLDDFLHGRTEAAQHQMAQRATEQREQGAGNIFDGMLRAFVDTAEMQARAELAKAAETTGINEEFEAAVRKLREIPKSLSNIA